MKLFYSLLLLLCAVPVWAEFKNQFACQGGCGTDITGYLQYATNLGYEWVLGDPWDPAKASAAKTAGLKVLYNTNTDRNAKWYSLNNPTGSVEGSEPTRINIGRGLEPITDAMYTELDKTLCMQSYGPAMGFRNLYDEANKRYKYYRYKSGNVGSSIPLNANRRSVTANNLNLAAAIRHRANHEAAAGKHLYDGIFFDESRATTNYDPVCYNPLNSEPGEAMLYENGRTHFFLGLVDDFQTRLGAGYGGATSNPYAVANWGGPARFPSALLYSEGGGGIACDTLAEQQAAVSTGCGNQNAANYGSVSPAIVMHQQTKVLTGDYSANLLIYGRTANPAVLAWGGWYGEPFITNAGAGVHLVKVIPNWENMVSATSRTWNETTDTYTSSNAFMSPLIAYARHHAYATNHKLFVVRQSGSPTVTLQSTEKVVNAQCTNAYFTVTGTCVTGYFTQSGNTVSLGGNVVNGNGYILTVHRQPTFLSAEVSAVNTLDVCHHTDDAPTAMQPLAGATGYIVRVDTVIKAPTSVTRQGTNCFRLLFDTGTITSSANNVTVAYTAGTITSGTNMINTTNKVAAANFGAQNAQNTLGGGGGGDAVVSQTSYRWQSIEGSADDASLYGNVNQQLVPSPGGRARLIIKIRNTVNTHVPTDFPLYYVVDPANATDPNQGVPVTDSCEAAAVCFTSATGIGSRIPTTEFLPSQETTDLACGVIESEANLPVLTMPAASETECIYSLKFNNLLTASQRVYLIPRHTGNSLLNAYTTSNLPHATITSSRSDQRGSLSGGSLQ